VGSAGIALLMSGLAMIVAAGDLVQLRRQRMLRSAWAASPRARGCDRAFLPWTASAEVATSLPATAIANFWRQF
jgi:hypothetical protein